MTNREKIQEARDRGIDIPDVLLEERNIVGIYKFFYWKENEEFCFYIGKSTNIAGRLLQSGGGHIYKYLKKDFTKLVPCKIDEYLKEGYRIKVVIREVDYRDTIFSRAAHRLALAELQEIVNYQENGQCLLQHPDGVGKHEEDFWEENYKL